VKTDQYPVSLALTITCNLAVSMDTDKLSVYVKVAQKEAPVQDIPIRHDMYVMHLCLNVDYIS